MTMKRTFVVILDDTGQGDPGRRVEYLLNSVPEFLVTKVTEIPTENGATGWIEAMSGVADLDQGTSRPSDLEIEFDEAILAWLANGGPHPTRQTAN